jgi:DNA-binding transcriptional LysR family regulator
MTNQSARSLEELSAFAAVVEANGFTAAARVTGVRKATLSLRVAALERRLGAPLLIRTTRSIRLTDEGRNYFAHARKALAAVDDAEAVVAAAKASPSGLLRVTTLTAIADELLVNVVTPYLKRYPDIAVSIDSSRRSLDLAREQVDVAVRLGPLEDSEFVARRLGAMGGGCFASPAYLARRGTPKNPADLGAHDTIVVGTGDSPVAWPFLIGGKRRSISIRPRLVVNSFELGARAAAEGLGVLRAPNPPVRQLTERGELVRILQAWSPPPADMFVLTPPGGASLPKTRAFIDLLIQLREGAEQDAG